MQLSQHFHYLLLCGPVLYPALDGASPPPPNPSSFEGPDKDINERYKISGYQTLVKKCILPVAGDIDRNSSANPVQVGPNMANGPTALLGKHKSIENTPRCDRLELNLPKHCVAYRHLDLKFRKYKT